MPLQAVTFSEALHRLVELAKARGTAYVVTANVDHVVRCRRNPALRSMYTGADMVVADGMPLIWASRLLGKGLPERVAGSDLFPALCARAAEEGLSVFLLGGAPETARRSAEILQGRHPTLRVVGTYCPALGFASDTPESQRVVTMIHQARPDILFVALGSPKQEQWIVSNREACGAGVSLGVGISFSFLCGDVSRAPRWMRRMGLEWLHRLAQEPARLWKRYLWEDPAFVFLVLREFWRARVMGSHKISSD